MPFSVAMAMGVVIAASMLPSVGILQGAKVLRNAIFEFEKKKMRSLPKMLVLKVLGFTYCYCKYQFHNLSGVCCMLRFFARFEKILRE